MAPGRRQLAAVALRDPLTSHRTDSHPKALLSGDTSAVLRYNCLSRILSVLANMGIGIPTI